MGTETDEELMLKYQEGDEHAFGELYRRYERRIYGYLSKRLDQKSWVDDVFQTVFIKLHKSRHQYDSSYLFSQWIFVMTKTILLDFWKTTGVKTSRYFSSSLEDLSPEQIPTTSPVLETENTLPEHALAMLSSDQRMAVEHKFIDELSYNEIAKRLNRSEESVRQLVSRAIRKIRSGLGTGGT